MALIDSLNQTNLSLGGATPKSSEGLNTFANPGSQTINPDSLKGSQLDLDGKTPEKYLDNPPQ